MAKGKKTKLQSFADEIAKLERSVKRRSNQLEKLGVEVDKPKHEKPKTVKEAKQVIFQLESFLRHNSKNEGIRKAAKIGSNVKEKKHVDKVYKEAKRLREEATKAFTELIKKPINEELKNNGMRPLSFEDMLEEFTIGNNPKDMKNKNVMKEFTEIYRQDAEFLKNHPKNSGELFVDSKISDYKREVLEQLNKSASIDEYSEAMNVIMSMDNRQFVLWYAENEHAINTLKYKYTERSSDWSSIESLTGSLFETLGVREREEV